jgi:hypothetical protein
MTLAEYRADVDACIETLALCNLMGIDPAEEFGAETATAARNLVSAHFYALDKNTCGRTWFYSECVHPAVYRALKLDRAEEGATFAAGPFRLHRSDDGPRVLAAFPCPRCLPPETDDDWLGIETVLSWDPRTGAVEVMGDAEPNQLIGRAQARYAEDDDTVHVYADAFAFFRAYAEDRARWVVARQMVGGDWRQKPSEPDLTPGLLLIGEPEKVAWPRYTMPPNVICHGIDPKAVNRAMLRQARIPRAVAAGSAA